MDLKQLRYFVSIAELGSFTRASAHLRITQPALSRQMARLAAEMKVPLLRRDGRNIALTAAGEVLLERARFLLRQAEQIVVISRFTFARDDTLQTRMDAR